MATGCQNYSIEELSWLLTERHHGLWHLLFVNSAWWLWNRSCKQTMSATTVASSLNLKDRAAARSARCVAQDIASTSYLANVAICWPAKTVDATDCRHSNLSLSRKRPHQIRHLQIKQAFSSIFSSLSQLQLGGRARTSGCLLPILVATSSTSDS